MSTPWRITRGDQQFTITDVAGLKLAAVAGKIRPGDLVQPPGRTDWLYATEVRELQGLVKGSLGDDDDLGSPRRRGGGGGGLRAAVFLVGLGVIGGGFYSLYWFSQNAPDGSENALFGEHEGALSPLDALATEYANLLENPDSRAKKIGEVKKDARVQLIRKMGDFYEVSLADGSTGWLGTTQVIPGYKFDMEMSQKYDPLFNPEDYLQLTNYSWTPRGDDKEPENLTDMMFEVNNPTDYGMEGVALRVTFRDGSDKVFAVKDIEIPRLLPPHETLFLDGIEMEIEWDEATTAKVIIYGARALLPAEYSKLKAEEEARLEKEAAEEGGEPGSSGEITFK